MRDKSGSRWRGISNQENRSQGELLRRNSSVHTIVARDYIRKSARAAWKNLKSFPLNPISRKQTYSLAKEKSGASGNRRPLVREMHALLAWSFRSAGPGSRFAQGDVCANGRDKAHSIQGLRRTIFENSAHRAVEHETDGSGDVTHQTDERKLRDAKIFAPNDCCRFHVRLDSGGIAFHQR